jgi:hypothetical protein
MKDVESKIVTIRNERVILDCDVAALYGVPTKEINQAVRNNPEKFPAGYIIQTTNEEKKEVVKNFDHLEKLKFSPVNPTAFTERGLYMLATILKGKTATQTTINIIDTFVEIRALSRMVANIPNVADDTERKSLLKRSGEIISNVLTSDLEQSESETEIELNFAMLKIKHKVKKERKK